MSDVGGSAFFDVEVDVSGTRQLGDAGADALRRLRASLEGTDDEVAKLARRLRTLSGLNSGAGPRLSAQFEQSARAVRQLGGDLSDLITRTRAFQRQFQSQGLDPDLLRLQTNQLERLLDLQRRTQQQRARIAADPQVRRAFQLEFDQIARALTREGAQLVSIQRDNNAERARLAREGARERAAAESLGLVEARRIANLEVAAARSAQRRAGVDAQTQGQLAVTAARSAGQQRVAITRGVVDTIGRLERGLGVTLRGIARTSVGAISGIWEGTVGSVRRSFTTRRQIISGGLRNETRLFQQQSIQIQRIQQQSSTGLIGAARFGGLGAGLAGGLGAGALLTQGFERAANIENIQKRLNVLLNNNVFASRALFLQLAAFAKTTAFDLTGVADLASRLLTANVAVEDILPNIKALSGAITLVGGTTDDLNGIARALGQIVSVGRLTAEEINQISERLPGINVRQLFSDALGFESVQAFVKAQEAGEITGEAAVQGFFRAVRGDPRFAQALEEGANSFSNLRANAIEAFADIGAAFFERLEGPVKAGLRGTINAFSGLASFIRGGNLTSGLELLRLALGKVAIALGGVVAAKAAVEVFQLLGKGVGLLLTPMGLLAAALTAGGAAFLFFFQRSEAFRNTVLRLRDAAFEFGRRGLGVIVEGLENLRDRLEPLLAPLLRFKDRIVGVIQAFRRGVSVDGFGQAFRDLALNLRDVAADLFRASLPLRERIGDLLGNARDMALRFRDRIVEAVRSIDFGAVAGLLRTELGQTVAASLAGGLIGGFAGGPVGALLGAAAGALFAKFVLPAIRRAIDGFDVAALFGKFLNGVREVGRRIALILTDRRTLLGVAGIAAAAAAIAVQFVSGFVSGLLSNLDDIAAAGATILNALFAQNSLIKSLLALGILLRSQLISLFRRVFGDAGREGGKAAIDGATQGAQSRIGVFASTLKSGLARAGRVAASGLATALSAGLAGSALGDASSNLERGLGLAGIAGSAASAFAIAGGGPQGAALAAGTAGVGLLTAALTANARRAAEARGRMEEYATAVKRAGEEGKTAASGIQATFSERLLGASDKVLEGFDRLGLSARGIGEALASGGGPAILEDLNRQLDETQRSIVRGGLGRDELNAANQRFRDLERVIGFVRGELNAVNDAARRRDLENSVEGDIQGFARLGTGISNIIDKLREAGREGRRAADERRRLFQLEQSNRLESGLAGIRDRASEIATEADEAKRKLRELLTPQTPDVEVSTAETITSLGGISGQIQEALKQGVDTGLGKANLTLSLDNFGDLVGTQFSDALLSSDPAAALQASLFDTTFAINQLDVPQEVKDQLLTNLNASFETANSKIPVGVEVKELEAQAAGVNAQAQALQAAVAAGGITLPAAADIATAIAAGEQIQLSADAIVRGSPAEVQAIANATAAESAGDRIASAAAAVVAANPPTVGDNLKVNTGPAFQAGLDIAAGLRSGISAGTAQVAKQAAEAVDRAIIAAKAAAGVSSPSKVFAGIGSDLMKGLALGIRDSSDEVVSAIQEVVEKISDPRSPIAKGLQEGVSSLFSTVFERGRIFGGGGSQLAAAQITTAMKGILSTVEQNASTLFAAGAKPAGERTLSERLLLGESFTSLRLGDEFGVANRSAIQQAVEAISGFGEAMLAQGFTAQQTAARLAQYRAQLILTATQAGLATRDVEAFINSLGLSPQTLNNFVRQVQTLNGVVNEARGRANQPAPNLTPGPNPQTQFFQFEEGAVNIAVPDGADGQFVALTTVNAIAQAVRG